MAKFTDKPWNGDKASYSPEQLLKAIPKAFAVYARSQSKDGEISKSDMHCPYKTPDGTVSLKGTSFALGRLPSVKGPSANQKASARAELERANASARAHFGKGDKESKKASVTLKEWNPRPDAYTFEDCLAAVPTAMLEIAVARAERENRQIGVEDLHFAFKEPDGTINLNGLKYAFEELSCEDYDLSYADKAAIRADLLTVQKKIEFESNVFAPIENSLKGMISRLSASLAEEELSFVQKPDPPVTIVGNKNGDPDSGFNRGPGADPSTVPGEGLDYGDSDGPGPSGQGYLQYGVGAPASIDTRPLPNFKSLGIDRPAGPATEEELAAFKGAKMPDGSDPRPENYWSCGVVLANNDYMPDRGQVIPGIELARMGAMLQARSKGSDEDHSRMVRTGHFLLVNPKIGVDPKTSLHRDNPLRGIEPYTALTARAIFPLTQKSPDHESQVEKIQRGLMRNVSITPQVGAMYCGACGERPISELIQLGNHIIGCRIHPDYVESLYDLEGLVGSSLLLRHTEAPIKDGQPNGVLYSDLMVESCDNSGCLSVRPIPRDTIRDGIQVSAMTKTKPLSMYQPMSPSDLKGEMIDLKGEVVKLNGSDIPRYCPIHGLIGSMGKDGKPITAIWANIKQLLNCAAVDAGAINDARFVLDPGVSY